MKKFASVLTAVIIMVLATIASAGVIIDEQQVIDQPNGNKVTRSRTVMIEGDKQKSIIENENRSVITDLGKGTMMMVDGTRKTYIEFPFPPKGEGMAAMQGTVSPTIRFKKTGGHDKIIGYSCDEYSGAGTVGGNSVSMTGCFSDSAPGASEYRNFQREMADKVKGTSMANMGQIPQGVPLRLTITTTLGNLPTAGMSPDQAGKLNQMLTHHQFVTDTTVSKISIRNLPADSFQAPSGYQQQQPPPMLGGMGASPPMPPPPPNKVPE
ncbi:MAG: DUF4412 domain-containing protein [Deltaproteobacteria bacterium]|nr:DUF4412 domain-containing protein [Deltaproteobacteria bacterium]